MDALLTPLGFWYHIGTLPLPYECLPHPAWAFIMHDRLVLHCGGLIHLGFGHPLHDCHLLPCCCPPPPAQDLIPYIRQPLLGSPFILLRCSDTASVHLFTWKLFSNCFGSDNPYQPAGPCGFLLLPGWALTSNAGQLPCVYTLVILLGFWHHILDCPLEYGHFSYSWTHSLCIGCPSMWTLPWTTVVTSHQLWMCTLALGLNCWLGRGGEKGEV